MLNRIEQRVAEMESTKVKTIARPRLTQELDIVLQRPAHLLTFRSQAAHDRDHHRVEEETEESGQAGQEHQQGDQSGTRL